MLVSEPLELYGSAVTRRWKLCRVVRNAPHREVGDYKGTKMNNRFQRITSISLLLVGVLLVFSCAGPPEVGISEDTLYDDTRVYYEREYQLGSNDTLEIVYHYSPKPTSKVYYLAVGDVIRVEFAYHPEINRDLHAALHDISRIFRPPQTATRKPG